MSHRGEDGVGLETTGEPGTSVSVILPAYNEEAAVGAQVECVRRVLSSQGITHEILVIDDGSEDRTAEEALRAHARVLQHPENRGYGAAIKAGIVAARYETIVIMDADGTYPTDQIPDLLARLETSDMVVGARLGRHVHMQWSRRLGKWLLVRLATRVAGQPIPDLNSGMRVFRRRCVEQYFPILSNRFSFTTTVTLALLADDYRVSYHPINYHRRIGKSKIAPWHFLDFTILVLRMAILFQPLKVFVPLAFLCGLLGALKGVYDIATLFLRHPTPGWSLLYQPVISTSAILLLLVGLQLLLIGMVADGVVRRIAQYNGALAPSHAVWVLEAPPDPQVEKQDMTSTVKQ